MAERDPALEKLEDLITRLESYGKQVKEHVETIEGLQGSLDDVEDEAEKELGALQKEVEEVQSELDDSEDDALGQVRELTSEARDLAGERLTEAQGDLDEAAEGFGSRADKEASELDEARRELADEGFDTADEALDTAETEYQGEEKELDTAFQDMVKAVGETTKNLQDAVQDMVAKIQASTKAVSDAERKLEGEASDTAKTFDTSGGELLQELKAASDGAKSSYDTVEQGGDAAQEEVNAAFANGCDASAQWAGQTGEQLGNDAEDVTVSQASHKQTLEALQQTAEAEIDGTVDEFATLAEDLRRCCQVVDQIDQMLANLGGA